MELKKMEDLTTLLLQEIKNRRRCRKAGNFFLVLFIISTLATVVLSYLLGINLFSLFTQPMMQDQFNHYLQLIITTYGFPYIVASILQQFFLSWMIFFKVSKNKKNTNVAYLHAELINSAPAI